MPNTHPTLSQSDFSDFGIERRDDIRHEIFKDTADALIAAGLIDAHQIPGQPGAGKTLASYLPNGKWVRSGSDAVRRVLGSVSVCRAGSRFVIERRLGDAEVSRREACNAALWTKQNEARAEAIAWELMRTAIEQCCFGELRLAWQTEV